MRSAIGGREGSVTPRRSIEPTVVEKNQTSKAQTPLLSKRRRMDGKLDSGKNTPQNLLDLENHSPFLTQRVDFSRTPSPRSVSECSSVFLHETTSEDKRIQEKSPQNPYDLRELSSVLSLYGEQQAPTFRKGFLTPVMTEEKFQEHLLAMSSKPELSSNNHRSSLSRSSTSSLGLSPLLQQRRRSVLLREHNFRDRPFLRNLSDPLMDHKLPVKTNNQRRHSLMVGTHYENGTK
jgi:hypothetical protein